MGKIDSLVSAFELLQLENHPTPSFPPALTPASTFRFPMTSTALQLFLASQPTPLHYHFYTSLHLDSHTGREQLCFQGSKWYQAAANLLEWLQRLRDEGLEFEALPLDFVYHVAELNEFKLVPIDPALQTRLGNPFLVKPAKALTSRADFYDLCGQQLLAGFQTKCRTVSALPSNLSLPALLPSSDYLLSSCFAEIQLEKCLPLGRGGFGEVYLTRFRRTPESPYINVALKVIKTERIAKDRSLDGFVREYRLMRACRHPNVIKTYGYTCVQGRWALVLEYCEKSFIALIQSATSSLPQKMQLVIGVARGLAYLHEKSIAHLDIKPHNVLMGADDLPKITDFGLSRKMMTSGNVEKVGFTLHYTSPEQLRGSGFTLKADIWSFGNLLYYVIYGKAPYLDMMLDTGNAHSYAARKDLLMELESNHRLPVFSDLAVSSKLHIRLHRVMQDCWVLEPALRPSMSQVLRQLEKAGNS